MERYKWLLSPVLIVIGVVILLLAMPEIPASVTPPDVHKSMEVKNEQGYLSNFTFVDYDIAYMSIWSVITAMDVHNIYHDFVILAKRYNIHNVDLFMYSGGGDAFSGLALADLLEKAKKDGFHIVVHASGIIASAAVPIFVVCDERCAAPGTIFMVHETSIWKWPGNESHSDIISQGKLMDLLRDKYMAKMTKYSKLDLDEWLKLEAKTTWFSAEQAKKWGLVDRIE